ncbi:MAG: MotE family protein [Ferrovibrio sp.]|uniref:MotE family protein n=1 Tax=Ferrovibrio sp. TaxID=1917215 RepID=UPI0039193EE7
MTNGRQAQAMQAGKPRLASRVRVLPLTILAVALLLGLKIGALWQGRAELFVTPAGAQQQGAGQGAGQPTQLTPRPAAQAQAQAQPPAQASTPQPAAPQSAAPQSAATQTPAAAQAPGQPGGGNATPSSSVKSLADRDPTTFTRAEIELLANLAQRRDQLEQRAREIDLRESLLAAAEKRIDERIAELKKLEGSIKQIVQQYDKQEEQNLQGLVKVYENMKPKDAARIFEQLDANVLLGVVERMKEAKLAAVLADMSPATAQDLTVRLATRKQIPPSLRAGAESQIQPAAAPPTAAPPAARPAGQAPAAQAPAPAAPQPRAPGAGG